MQEAIEAIKYRTGEFPKEALDVIRAHRDEAIPILRDSIRKVFDEPDSVADDDNLYFLAMFLLGEFQDRKSFPLIVELASLPPDTMEDLIDDALTESLQYIAYNVYNGDLDLLKQAIHYYK